MRLFIHQLPASPSLAAGSLKPPAVRPAHANIKLDMNHPDTGLKHMRGAGNRGADTHVDP